MSLVEENEGYLEKSKVWNDIDAIAEEVKVSYSPINYKLIIGDNDVLFIGENHFNPDVRIHLIEYVKQIKEAGVTHFLFETAEGKIETFQKLNNREEINAEELKNVFGDKLGVELAQALVAEGIYILPIDINSPEPPKPPQPLKSKKDLNRWIKEEREYRRIIKEQEKVWAEVDSREQFLTDNIIDILNSNSGSKMAVLIGLDHVSKFKLTEGYPTVRRRMEELSIKTISVGILGGFNLGMIMGWKQDNDQFLNALQRANLSDQEFMLDLRPYSKLNSPNVPFGPGEVEFLIHLPQDSHYQDLLKKVLTDSLS